MVLLPPLANTRRRQIAVDQPQGGVNYPFCSPSDQIEQVIGDLHLTYRDDQNVHPRPFSVQQLSGFGSTTTDRQLRIVDANGEVVFDTLAEDTAYQGHPWGPRLLIHEWLQADDVLRAVEYWSQHPDDPVVVLPSPCQPRDGTLDDRACIQLPLQLRSLRVGLTEIRGTGVVFQSGYNTSITVAAPTPADGTRLVTNVAFEMLPGEGQGLYDPGPPAYVGIKTINGRGPTASGNFIWDATDCYRVERPVLAILQENPREVLIQDHALQCFNDCGPCCSCQDFLNVYEALRVLRNTYAALIARAQTARDTYLKNRQRFMDQAACRKADSLRVQLIPQCPNGLDVAIGYCNNTGACIKNLYLMLSFQYQGGNGSLSSTGPTENTAQSQITCGSTYRNGNVQGATKAGTSWRTASRLEQYALGGQWPNYWAYFDAVDPGALASITARFHFKSATTAWNIIAVGDAYTVAHPGPVSPGLSPVPGHALGQDPSTPAALAARIVSSVVIAQSGLIVANTETGCCLSGDPDTPAQYTGEDG
jgi:hypothetical protein